jgi:hypothetical protein
VTAREDEGSGVRGTPKSFRIVLVTRVGDASGARAAAAALACAGSDPDCAGLMIDLADGRAPRPALIATAAARQLEERLAAHLPAAGVASRGRICQLKLPPDPEGIEQIPAALPIARGSAAVVHLPPRLLQPALAEARIRPTAALLRADLAADRALAALAARDLIERGLRVAILKRPLGWLAARGALLGAPPTAAGGLPARLCERLLQDEDNNIRQCYDREDESRRDRQEASETPWTGRQRLARAQQWGERSHANGEAGR